MANYLRASCPRCDRTDGIDVAATVWVRLTPEGTDADAAADTSHEYTDTARATCALCGHEGTLADFTAPVTPLEVAGDLAEVLERIVRADLKPDATAFAAAMRDAGDLLARVGVNTSAEG